MIKIKQQIFLLAALLCSFSTIILAQDKQVKTYAKFEYFKYSGNDKWFEQNIDKTAQYLNPIVSGFYPDPSICRKGDTYYLVNSTFGYFPGVPIFTSKDLVNWKQIGHVLDRPSQFNFAEKDMSRGIFAPAIEYNPYNDTFYMITTDNGGIGNFFVKTKDPLKGWSDPILLPEVKYIDPSFFFDEDGKGYIVHNNVPENGAKWPQHRTIRIHEFDVENDRTIGKSKEIISNGSNPELKPIWDEGPHLYKINGYYYLMCAEGGTAAGHSEVVFRSDSPWGPFEPSPYNPILTQKSLQQGRENMVASTGHADIIQTPQGDWWAVFLGVRPYDGKNTFNTGRETFLLPVEWENNFPIILRKQEPVPIIVAKKDLNPEVSVKKGNFSDVQNFDSDQLDFSWIYIRTPQKTFHCIKKGKLYINPSAVNIDSQLSPSALVRRQQHTNFSVETQIDFNPRTASDFAGLTLFQNDKFYLIFGKTIVDGKVALAVERKQKDKSTVAMVVLTSAKKSDPIKLKVEGRAGNCDFSYSLNGKNWIKLAENVDATNLSTQVAGGFIGTTVGLYATSNHSLNK